MGRGAQLIASREQPLHLSGNSPTGTVPVSSEAGNVLVKHSNDTPVLAENSIAVLRRVGPIYAISKFLNRNLEIINVCCFTLLIWKLLCYK